jgi:hypothetical protein
MEQTLVFIWMFIIEHWILDISHVYNFNFAVFTL